MKIEVLCEAGSADRLNEDAVFLHQTEDEIVAAVIDGATERLPSTALLPLLQIGEGQRLTSAAYAAQITREALETVTNQTPYDMLVAANDALRARMETQYGELTPEAVYAREPALSEFRDDMRLMRMVLPVCVVTVVKLNLKSNQMAYAHLGDSTLLLFHKDGAVEVAAGDDGRVGSGGLIARMRQRQYELSLSSFREVLSDPQVIGSNHRGALYHNYVDELGKPDPSRGIGVINGLPEIEAFIQHGVRPLDAISGIFLLSDGLMWPTEVLNESSKAVMQRLQRMRQMIEAEGLRGYFKQLRQAQELDNDFNRFPRFKLSDDASGIMIYL